MRFIVGFGNELRGEDGFAVAVLKELEKYELKDTVLISCFQLTPELCLELLEADHIVFVDAAFSNNDHYALATVFLDDNEDKLSHHISIKMIITLLENLYNKKPKFEVFSILTNSFDIIKNKELYQDRVFEVSEFLKDVKS